MTCSNLTLNVFNHYEERVKKKSSASPDILKKQLLNGTLLFNQSPLPATGPSYKASRRRAKIHSDLTDATLRLG